MRTLRTALTALCATALLAAPALGGGSPTGTEDYLFAPGGGVHAQARYFDGLGSTKMAFLMFQGQSGAANDRLSAGARCTEWHGAFTQVTVKAGEADNAGEAFYAIGGFLAAAPPMATGQRTGVGFHLDALGGPGAWEGTLTVCDHPDGDGVVDFVGALTDMPFTHAPYAGLVHVQEV